MFCARMGYTRGIVEQYKYQGAGIGIVFVVQGDPRELTKSIGLLHRPGSIPGPFIMWEKFTDA